MHKIKVYTIGKTKESWLQEALKEYELRLKATASLEWILAKNDAQLKQFLEKEPHFLCLDPNGKQLDSVAFSQMLIHSLEEMGARLSFVIGGSEGIPPEIKARSKQLVSLSKLTFTHQITRLILVEQIYRAFEIAKGTGYHK
ncbi:MAG: 23S rRNA (pseudouridine(1915)-N(3))-methyltransferase RlmH [Chlamydiota bacterium]